MKKLKRKRKLGPDCLCGNKNKPIIRLGVYFDVLSNFLAKDGTFWFRGNTDLTQRLTPSALRYTNASLRNKALDLLSDFKRFGEMKIPKIPATNEEFKWVQLAQHYGLPTRLLDWTRNAAIALYFACYKEFEKDGAVFLLNPIDLNRETSPKDARIFDPHKDSKLINKYLELDGNRNPDGLLTIAINPTWNSERIMLQQGVFTLHGSKYFTLTHKHAPSLVYLKIDKDNKQNLLEELERIGINEMSIFPEAEHMCCYLKWRDKLL
ncbi:MAG: FRG domain-containing protein [Phycisphaerae bacterium]|jgi:hypothetical protein